jgi:hypothetical protein
MDSEVGWIGTRKSSAKGLLRVVQPGFICAAAQGAEGISFPNARVVQYFTGRSANPGAGGL